eukprot:CAMPEP_0206184924 /NCGR_PEP_ID=MMETSP0166-20121206/1495_1 /ASSEMBLY_ACC=CAM_ASM_000260 /TAXON_ID=95228 /ORGANISM="Vannella robusta, Strain DIVA3 518/3/11/1/6" /LENGTH=724 /DNA_ID=CAMNT_0053600007 /DNA_START=299 /DNA_END=2470 /DNA_ORIENTATION=+
MHYAVESAVTYLIIASFWQTSLFERMIYSLSPIGYGSASATEKQLENHLCLPIVRHLISNSRNNHNLALAGLGIMRTVVHYSPLLIRTVFDEFVVPSFRLLNLPLMDEEPSPYVDHLFQSIGVYIQRGVHTRRFVELIFFLVSRITKNVRVMLRVLNGFDIAHFLSSYVEESTQAQDFHFLFGAEYASFIQVYVAEQLNILFSRSPRVFTKCSTQFALPVVECLCNTFGNLVDTNVKTLRSDGRSSLGDILTTLCESNENIFMCNDTLIKLFSILVKPQTPIAYNDCSRNDALNKLTLEALVSSIHEPAHVARLFMILDAVPPLATLIKSTDTNFGELNNEDPNNALSGKFSSSSWFSFALATKISQVFQSAHLNNTLQAGYFGVTFNDSSMVHRAISAIIVHSVFPGDQRHGIETLTQLAFYFQSSRQDKLSSLDLMVLHQALRLFYQYIESMSKEITQEQSILVLPECSVIFGIAKNHLNDKTVGFWCAEIRNKLEQIELATHNDIPKSALISLHKSSSTLCEACENIGLRWSNSTTSGWVSKINYLEKEKQTCQQIISWLHSKLPKVSIGNIEHEQIVEPVTIRKLEASVSGLRDILRECDLSPQQFELLALFVQHNSFFFYVSATKSTNLRSAVDDCYSFIQSLHPNNSLVSDTTKPLTTLQELISRCHETQADKMQMDLQSLIDDEMIVVKEVLHIKDNYVITQIKQTIKETLSDVKYF